MTNRDSFACLNGAEYVKRVSVDCRLCLAIPVSVKDATYMLLIWRHILVWINHI